MSASISSIAKTPALRNIQNEEKEEARDVCVAEERMIKFQDKGTRLSTYEREQLAFNLEKILAKYQLISPKFKRSTLLKQINEILAKDDLEKEALVKEVDKFDFSRWLNRVTLKEDKLKNNKELFSKVDRYILFTEAFLLETEQTPKVIYESLTLGTQFHHNFISERAYEEDKVVATRIYDRLMFRINLLDKQYGILQTYEEINELVIIANSNGGDNYWPIVKQDISPDYYIYLSNLYDKGWLKDNGIEDVPLQDTDLDMFHPDDQRNILQIINRRIFKPLKDCQELKKPMKAYHFNGKGDFEPELVNEMPHFQMGDNLFDHDLKVGSTWGEYKEETTITQKEIDKADVKDWDSPWTCIVLYPSPDALKLIPIYVGGYGDCAENYILDIEKITQLLHNQFAQPKKKWKKNDELPEFWKLILAEDGIYFESIFRSFEETVTNLKNHPLLIQAKNIKAMADKFTERFNKEKLRE